MKKYLAFASLVLLILPGVSSFKTAPAFEPVVVVELFTSQGCSSCPPADKVLSRVIADTKLNHKKIFPLSFHVDYWNRLGWIDSFSNKKFSQRQSDYTSFMSLSSSYTPQMVVNGTTQFVGSDETLLDKALATALKENAKVNFKALSVRFDEAKAPVVKYELEGDFSECKINFALLSTSETTQIKRGENGGRTITSENVVRQLVNAQAAATGQIEFSLSPLPQKGNRAVVVFVQRISDLKILGAAVAMEG